jgi:hypothetical protein
MKKVWRWSISMKAIGKFARPIALLFSISLVGTYVWYNSSRASRQVEPSETVTETKYAPIIQDAPAIPQDVDVPASAPANSPILLPGSKYIVLPGSKSAGVDTSLFDIPSKVPPAPEAKQKQK